MISVIQFKFTLYINVNLHIIRKSYKITLLYMRLLSNTKDK